MTTKDAYNIWAATYDEVKNQTRDLEGVVLKKMTDKHLYDDILEIGCGTGKNSVWLFERCSNLTAVDLSEEMLRIAKKKNYLKNIEFRQADITHEWDFKKVNLVTCSLVLEHICDIDHIFQQAHKTLHENGEFYICELHPYKQLQGSRAKFEFQGELVQPDYFIHHLSDFFMLAIKYDFHCLEFEEWFDEENRNQVPRLCSFLFKKMF